MKIKIYLTTIIVIATVFSIYSVGFQCGNIRIGKQVDLAVEQDFEYKKSAFYQKYYTDTNLSVLNIWATWCKPCLAEVPELNSVKDYFKNDSINFISLSIDDDSVALRKYLNTNTFQYIDMTFENLKYRKALLNLLDNRPMDEHQLSYAVPKTFLFKNGKVLETLVGSLEKEELISLINKYK